MPAITRSAASADKAGTTAPTIAVGPGPIRVAATAANTPWNTAWSTTAAGGAHKIVDGAATAYPGQAEGQVEQSRAPWQPSSHHRRAVRRGRELAAGEGASVKPKPATTSTASALPWAIRGGLRQSAIGRTARNAPA